jgi:hypothetical protein
MQRLRLAAMALAAGGALAAAPASAKKTCEEFAELFATLEQNATDGDAEVVLFAQGQDDGLSDLSVEGPDGRKVLKVKGKRRSVGLREFLFESAEPPDLPRVLESFPEGEYTVSGRTVTGDCLEGSVFLSHELAPATTLLSPEQDEEVPAGDLTLEWAAVPEAELYVVELQNEDLGNEFSFEVLPGITSLTVPAALVEPGSEYQFGVAVRTAVGNVTSVELTFTTAP